MRGVPEFATGFYKKMPKEEEEDSFCQYHKTNFASRQFQQQLLLIL